jgi:hypothetical protein
VTRPAPRRLDRRAEQRGLTLLGLLFWALVIGFVGYLLVRLVPTVYEYLTIQRALDQIAATQPATVAEARAAFDRQKAIETSISAISGKDLVVTKDHDRVVLAFAYDKQIPVVGPLSLLIRYEGRSKPGH